MIGTVDDELIDQIEIKPSIRDDSAWLVEMSGPREVVAARSALKGFEGWRTLQATAEAVRDGGGFDSNDYGFIYDTDLDECDEPFQGVLVYDAGDHQVCVSLPAFERLMARFFRAIIRATPRLRPKRLNEPFWPEFVRITEELERRVAAQQANGASKDVR